MSTKVNVIRYNTSIETPTSHQIFMPNLKKRCDIELKILHSTNIVLFTTCNKLPKKQFKYSLQRSPGTQQTSVTSAH